MGNNEVGKINLGVNLTSPGMQNQISGMANTAAKFAKKAFAVVGTAMGAASITAFAKSCLELGSNLTEVQNVVDTTFGDMSNSVNDFAINAMEAFGMSETIAKKYMGTFGAMSKAMGLSTQKAYEMAEAVTGLTGDVASFFNLSTDEAYTKLKSIWTGETETLKDLGVVMTQTALDQYAMNNGFGKTTANMTEQEKLMLRYQYVMDALSDASGDFAKTSKTWANQTRVLSLRFDALKASIGQGLINLFTPVLVMLNDLLASLQKVADGFSHLTEVITGTKQATGGLIGISDAAGMAADSVDGIGTSATNTANAIKRSLTGFDKIKKLSDSSSSGSTTGSSTSDISAISNETGKATGKLTAMERMIGRIKSGFSDSFMQIADSAKSIGNTIWTNLTGGFQQWVDEDGERVKGRLDEIFQHTVNISDSIGEFSEAFADVFSIFETPEAQNITGNLISIFEDSYLNINLLSAKFVDDIIDTITSPFVENKDTIRDSLGEMLKPISEISDKVKTFTQDVWDTFQNLYDTFIHPAFESVKEIWTEYLGSDDFKEHMSSMKDSLDRINDSIQPILDAFHILFTLVLGSKMAQARDGIKAFGQIGLFAFKAIVSGIDLAIKNIANLTQFVSNLCNGGWRIALENMSMYAQQNATKAVSSIKNAFASIPRWFEQTFSNAWSKVQQVFSRGGSIFVGIQDGITSAFRDIVNHLIDGINAVVRKPFTTINSMLNMIRNTKVLNVRPFQLLWKQNPIDIPKINYLAKGGLINQPTLAMVGEAGKEAVMPLENNTGWIDQLADKIAQRIGIGKEMLQILKELLKVVQEGGDTVLYIGDEEIARASNRGAAKLSRRYGTVELEV